MERVYFFTTIFVFSFVASMNIQAADSDKQGAAQDHGVTPVSPKKKNCLTHPVTPVKLTLDSEASPLDHGVTPIKGSQDNKENDDVLVRAESFNGLRSRTSLSGFPSNQSLSELYAIMTAASMSPTNSASRKALNVLQINTFRCDHGVSPVR